MPGAEIILSTWEGEDTAGLDYDRLIISADPGTFKSENGKFFNVNRQIVSTYNGLRLASRPYAVKFRSDTLLEHAGFLQLYDQHPERSRHCRLFKKRIIGCQYYFRNPARGEQTALFYPSDIFHFGTREDLLDFWDLPLADKTACSGPLVKLPKHRRLENPLRRQHAEQYLWTAYLRKRGYEVNLNYSYEFSLLTARFSELSIINNFTVAESSLLGLKLPRRVLFWPKAELYNHVEWKQLYEIYCENGGSRLRQVERLFHLWRVQQGRIRRHLANEAIHLKGRIQSKIFSTLNFWQG